MKIEIQTDPKLFNHYIIGVAIHAATAGKKAGSFYLKYRPIHFTNDDVEKIDHAQMLSVDKLFKTTNREALECVGKLELANTLAIMKLAALANQCTIHHFSSASEFTDEHFDTVVKAANKSKYFKKLLRESLIRG